MKLRGDFVEAISRLYVEKHKPQQYKKLLEKEEQDVNHTISFTKLALHNKSFYDLINKQEGFLALQSYFVKATLLLDREPLMAYPSPGLNQQQMSYMQGNTGLAGPQTYTTTQNYRGMNPANTNQYSNYCIEVDEFKFFKIIQNVIQLTSTSSKIQQQPQQPIQSNERFLEQQQNQEVIDGDDILGILIGQNDNFDDFEGLQDNQPVKLNFYSSSQVDSNVDIGGLQKSSYRPKDDIGALNPNLQTSQDDLIDEQLADHNQIDWLMSTELYEILDSCGFESVGFREFCAFVLIVASINSAQLVRCLYDHGALLFDIIGAGQQYISGERLKLLGRILAVNQEIMQEVLDQFDLTYTSIIQFEDFQMFYFEVFQQIDMIIQEQVKEAQDVEQQLILKDDLIKIQGNKEDVNLLQNNPFTSSQTNQIDSSSFLFDKLNNSKENQQLIEKLKRPKPRKLEPIASDANSKKGGTKPSDKAKTRDSIINQNIHEEDDEGIDSERVKVKPRGAESGQSNREFSESNNGGDRTSIVKATVQNNLKKNKKTAFCCNQGNCNVF
eukprot:403359675